jgi:hypothetical protein
MQGGRKSGIAQIAVAYGAAQGVFAFAIGTACTFIGVSQNWGGFLNVIALVIVMVLAHRSFRAGRDGSMSYGQGLGIGVLVGLVAAVVTGLLVYLYLRFINPVGAPVDLQAEAAAMHAKGMSQAQIDDNLAKWSTVMTPMGSLIFTMIIGGLTGFIVALLVPIVTRKDAPAIVE